MTREEHYAEGEKALVAAKDARYNPEHRAALAACAQAHFLAALAAPEPTPVPSADQSILSWGGSGG